MTCGIYKITSPSGKCYIGSSDVIERRTKSHFSLLARAKHNNWRLTSAYVKYGNALTAETIIICSKDDLLLYEQCAMDAFKPEYNCSLIAGRPEWTPERIAKQQATVAAKKAAGWSYPKGRKMPAAVAAILRSPEVIEKQKASRAAKKAAGWVNPKRGRRFTDEERKKKAKENNSSLEARKASGWKNPKEGRPLAPETRTAAALRRAATYEAKRAAGWTYPKGSMTRSSESISKQKETRRKQKEAGVKFPQMGKSWSADRMAKRAGIYAAKRASGWTDPKRGRNRSRIPT